MTSHTHRPMTHTHGLQDDCPRCAQHAEHPTASLDDENLRRVITLAVRPEPFEGITSRNETTAVANVLDFLYAAGPLMRVAPDLALDYWRRMWRAEV